MLCSILWFILAVIYLWKALTANLLVKLLIARRDRSYYFIRHFWYPLTIFSLESVFNQPLSYKFF